MPTDKKERSLKKKLFENAKENAQVVPFEEISAETLEKDDYNDKEVGDIENETIEAEKKLEETRERYIQEYKKCKNESDRHNLIIKTKNSIFNIFKSSENKTPVKVEDFYTDKLKENKKEYDQARIELGNTMYEKKKAELEQSGLSGDELEKALVNYKATEILAKTIIEERQKIIDSQIKDISKFNKLIDGYRRMPRWQRVALSTALFTVAAGAGVATGGVFAGYGLATMAAMKFGTSMAMGTLTTYSVKGIDLIKKTSDLKFIENQSKIKTILKDRFATNEITQEKYEKEIELLELEEKKRARNRMLMKAGVGIAIAGTAGHFAYDALGNGLSHVDHIDNLHNIKVDGVTGADTQNNIQEIINKEPEIKSETVVADATKVKINDEQFKIPLDENKIPKFDTSYFKDGSIAQQEVINNLPKVEHSSIEAVADHGQGAISTLRELQDKLKVEYNDNLDTAPESVKYILNTDAHKLAQEYGMYKPGEDAESAFIKSGALFKVDENGNLIYQEAGSDKSIILESNNNITEVDYSGKMSDTDNSGLENQEGVNKYKSQEQVNTNDDQLQATDDNYKPASQIDQTKDTPLIESRTKHELRGKILLNKSGDEVITTAPLQGLSTEDLHKIYLTFHDNINHLFPTDKLMETWDYIKIRIPADRLMEIGETEEVQEAYKPLIAYMHKLEEMTGFKPISENSITGTPAESITHFINRAMEKIQLEGKLNGIKL